MTQGQGFYVTVTYEPFSFKAVIHLRLSDAPVFSAMFMHAARKIIALFMDSQPIAQNFKNLLQEICGASPAFGVLQRPTTISVGTAIGSGAAIYSRLVALMHEMMKSNKPNRLIME